MNIKGIFRHVFGHAIEIGCTIIPGVTSHVPTKKPHVPGERGHKKNGTVLLICVEHLVWPHADCKEDLFRVGGKLPGETVDGRLRRPSHFRCFLGRPGIEQVLTNNIKNRSYLNLLAINSYFKFSQQSRINSHLFKPHTYLIAGNCLGEIIFLIPHHKIPPFLSG